MLPSGAPAPRWTPDRRNARYAHALALAELVLRGASYELGDGREIAVDGMLVTMWRLFEAYLARAVGEALRHRVGGRPEPQDRNFSSTPPAGTCSSRTWSTTCRRHGTGRSARP